MKHTLYPELYDQFAKGREQPKPTITMKSVWADGVEHLNLKEPVHTYIVQGSSDVFATCFNDISGVIRMAEDNGHTLRNNPNLEVLILAKRALQSCRPAPNPADRRLPKFI